MISVSWWSIRCTSVPANAGNPRPTAPFGCVRRGTVTFCTPAITQAVGLANGRCRKHESNGSLGALPGQFGSIGTVPRQLFPPSTYKTVFVNVCCFKKGTLWMG